MGSIPAHAGETAPSCRTPPSTRVDPRSRGGDRHHGSSTGSVTGRSPLTRGRHGQIRIQVGLRGSIPAHAGETEMRRWEPDYLRVDPRSRGGDWGHRALVPAGSGRSPLTRGRHDRLLKPRCDFGSIPAHAGETKRAGRGADPARVDPHSRGGDSRVVPQVQPLSGRSPLTRGRLLSLDQESEHDGSIPAHAGETQRGER